MLEETGSTTGMSIRTSECARATLATGEVGSLCPVSTTEIEVALPFFFFFEREEEEVSAPKVYSLSVGGGGAVDDICDDGVGSGVRRAGS